MKSSTYRLLNFVHCLAYLYGKNEQNACHIIEYGSKSQKNRIKTNLAYDLHVSKESLYQVIRGNLTPLGTILWACSKCVHDIPSLTWCLGAERQASNTTVPEMLKGTQYHVQTFDLHTIKSISVQSLSQIASNIHAPVMTIVKAFQHSGIKIEDKVKDLPVLVKRTDPRLTLKNYLYCIASVHGKTAKWLAEQLGFSYAKLVNIIKHDQPSVLISHLRKMPEIFQGFSQHNIATILHGNRQPLFSLMKRQIKKIHDRKDLVNFISLCARLSNVKLNDLAKQMKYTVNALRTALAECFNAQLLLMVAQLSHMLKMPVKLQQFLLDKTKYIMNIVPLPKALYFRIDYHEKPSENPVKNPYFMTNDTKGQFQKALNNQDTSTVHQFKVNIIDELAKEFGFSATLFWSANFRKRHNVTQLIQNNRNYPMNRWNWLKVFQALYTQLVVVNNMFGHLTNPKLIHNISINGHYINVHKNSNTLIHKLQNHREHYFTGKFVRTGVKVIPSTDNLHKEYYQPVIFFNQIKYNHHNIMKQAEFNYTKNFIKLGKLYSGDLVRIQAMIAHRNNQYNLFSPQFTKIVRRVHARTDSPVPSEIHALTGFAIENDKSGSYDFTTWGHNYGYVRYCKHQYSLWKQAQAKKGADQQ